MVTQKQVARTLKEIRMHLRMVDEWIKIGDKLNARNAAESAQMAAFDLKQMLAPNGDGRD